MRFLGLIAAFLITTSAAKAQNNTEIEDVISGQLEAFNERDVVGAWAFASPTIQQLFGTWQNFGAMVERGYPMVWDNREVQFLGLEDRAGGATQSVLLRDASGQAHVLEYMMIQTDEGWRISGVRLLPAPDLSA